MSRHPCSITNCYRLSRVLCYCCSKNFCVEHIKDHNEEYLCELYQLTNDINQLSESVRNQYRQQLDQWRHQSHQMIDFHYEKKSRELDSLDVQDAKSNEYRQMIKSIQAKVIESIREQNATQEQIQSFKETISKIQGELSQRPHGDFRLNLPLLIVDNNFIQVEKANVSFDLQSTVQSVLKTQAVSSDECIVMANNSRYLLVGNQGNLCLYDKNLIMVKQTPWIHGCIKDMCYSNVLARFILLAENGMFTLNEQTMNINEEKVFSKTTHSWCCCASTNQSLFLTARESYRAVQEYVYVEDTYLRKQKHLCCTHNEYIEHMKCSNNDTLALVILNDSNNERRLDLRSTEDFHQLWTISLEIHEKINIISCCTLMNDKGWLIVNLAENLLIHVTSHGEIKKTKSYHPSPQYAIQFDNKLLTILTDRSIRLHEIQ
ncbi:unnamed protein product [Adineta ricciae]|uniref:Uncharacterized protein n=1 Tax=Adineta ricciae TaxID=249248 RepID=A0A816BFL4_ADIRI|nr:unnamed protein product [Adineta ricciae]